MSKPRFFQVEHVAPATKGLSEVPRVEGVRQLVHYGDLAEQRMFLIEQVKERREQVKQLSTGGRAAGPPWWTAAMARESLSQYEAELSGLPPAVPIEACSEAGGTLVDGISNHPLIEALELAFRDHRPVRLSPDVIWLTICQGIACHIRENAERLRSALVSHMGPRTLTHVSPHPPGTPENPWDRVVGAWGDLVRAELGPTHELFVADFSTTGPAERIASQIVLLDAMQGYFDYVAMRVICGIPAIALEGSTEDWERIEDRVEGFARLDLGLDWWWKPLRPILRQFTSASRGEVDARFWQSIFRVHRPFEICHPHSMFGWAAVLFPYLSHHLTRASERNPWLTGGRLEKMLDPHHARVHRRPSASTEDGLFPAQFPSGMSSVPFLYEVIDPSGKPLFKRSMELLAGLVGVKQDPETLALSPEIGWAVRDRVES